MDRSSLVGSPSGSNTTKRFAPIRVRPQPPAFLLSIKTNTDACSMDLEVVKQ
uniref:Uncharacterized protein n=1 Tax=Echinococcus granulosus TaxID=6210 RepID=A0A068X2G5_ECHGR|nr:hypothetical protein EgrG_000335300 [Echinococcus granulosus]